MSLFTQFKCPILHYIKVIIYLHYIKYICIWVGLTTLTYYHNILIYNTIRTIFLLYYFQNLPYLQH